MKTLVVGATGATGRLLVAELLRRGGDVVAIVRTPENLPAELKGHRGLTVITGNALEMSESSLAGLVADCDAVASCLGHNLTFKGIYGQPRRLVRDSVRRLCNAVSASRPSLPTRFVLMNTAGNSERALGERLTLAEKCVTGLMRVLLPPHVDNEQAAGHLRTAIGNAHPAIEWVVVRPDTLIDNQSVTGYRLQPSPTRSALFDPGRSSRVNVAHFMAELIADGDVWRNWRGRMPVLYDLE